MARIKNKIERLYCLSLEVIGWSPSIINNNPIATRRVSITFFKEFSVIRFEKCAPIYEPDMEPNVIVSINVHKGNILFALVLGNLKHSEDSIVTRLTAKLRATDLWAEYLKIPTNIGNLNSAPPKPIRPPKHPLKR